ncbi:hypothetical protein [Pseudomonas aeruginosa]|uniref:hypothetical protein n=1 Tax=Pseudomonas aeruginosa TaxID=287 RepID=UPI001150C58D|nr:hypothetical protein [Pseudomonas aeruginosa]MBS9730336.1 hypothetical protein [Pseudomonas aeruginosa]TQH48748.1 hypothetical protein FLI59_31905 [Pseudomonas aeruginosa]
MNTFYIIQVDQRSTSHPGTITQYYAEDPSSRGYPDFSKSWMDCSTFHSLESATEVINRMLTDKNTRFGDGSVDLPLTFRILRCNHDAPVPGTKYEFDLSIVEFSYTDPSDLKVKTVDRWGVDFIWGGGDKLARTFYRVEMNPDQPNMPYLPGKNEPSLFYPKALEGAHPWVYWYIRSHELEFTSASVKTALEEKDKVIGKISNQSSNVELYDEMFPKAGDRVAVGDLVLLGDVLALRNKNPDLTLEEIHQQKLSRRVSDKQ